MMQTLQQIIDHIMSQNSYQDGAFVLKHSRSKIRKAGERVRAGTYSDDDVALIQDYRAAHATPMAHMLAMLKGCQSKVEGDLVFSARLKRLPTILDKLQRDSLDGKTPNRTVVTRMSDIAGCRVIVENLDALKHFDELLDFVEFEDVKLIKQRDYIANVKSTGYRGIHRIYRYPEGFDVEVQLRTKIQHTWSTAIELIDLVEGTTLKTRPEQSDKKWLDFFRIFSDILNFKEHGINPIIKKNLISELEVLERELCVFEKIHAFIVSEQNWEESYPDMDCAVISVIPHIVFGKKFMLVDTRVFTKQENLHAMALLRFREKSGHTTIMVNVDSFSELKDAYPAYRADITALNHELSEMLPSIWTELRR